MASVATHRDIHIVTEEATQRDMPPSPEVGDGITTIGMTEVLVEVEAQTAPQSDSHIRIAGEVEVDLQGKGHDACPCASSGEVLHIARQKLVRDFRQLVGKDDLLAQSDDKAIDAISNVFGGDAAVADLLCYRVIAHDRTCDELWEHRNIE